MYFYLTKARTIAQLDEYSQAGWEFVAWFEETWHPVPGIWGDEQRAALFRRPADPTPAEPR